MEKLTREQAIAEFRKMWNTIADWYEQGSKKYNEDAKEIYIRNNFGNVEIANDCILCQYTIEKNPESICADCKYCPISFSKLGICGCLSINSPYSKLNDYCNIHEESERDNKHMARLARKIASLPEREVG
ncbi:MAG: hypothetical protein ACI4F9_01080 [Lachnospiraceae bacterium]